MVIYHYFKLQLNYLNFFNNYKYSYFSKRLFHYHLNFHPILRAKFELCGQTVVRFKTHTTKGWKTIAATGQKLKAKDAYILAACEEGKGAVLHSTLIDALQKCDTLSSQIKTFDSLMSLSKEEIEKRTLFCQSLEESLKLYFTDFKLHQFGSSVNGLGFKGCDMDVSLETNVKNEEFITLKDVPTLESVRNGTVSQEELNRLTPMFMLRFVRRILRKHDDGVKEPILFIKARCPIIRFYNAKYDVFCDFSCESEASLRNTRFLRLVCHLDERFKTLTKLIRYWGKYGGFVGDIDMFNSYAFSLFVLHFCQRTDPPILPPVKEIIDNSSYVTNEDVSNVEAMLKDLEKFQKSMNSTSTEKLLREFFFYYLNFDFERILLPLTSSSIHKNNFILDNKFETPFNFGTISIQDPFNHAFNTTGVVTYRYCVKFISSLIQACEAYQEKANWIPGSEMWGLCSILKPPINEIKFMKDLQDVRKHQIKLLVQSDAALKLKKIFEHCLLFQCKEHRVFNDENNTKIILKLHCRIYNNTWQGRDAILSKLLYTGDNLLEMEHLVSKEIVQVQTKHKRELLSEFMCECSELTSENETSLIVDIDFKGTKYPYILVIFLREYIPYIFNKL